MRAYNIGTIVMIVVLAIFTCVIVGRLLWLGLRKKSKVEFKNYIKTYKFGKFLWVYILAIPLFAMSYHYSGCNGIDCFFKAFTSASKLFVLQFDVSLDLAQVNELYKGAIIFSYFIAILNLVLFVASCLIQWVWNGLARLRFLYSRSDKCLILGNNPNNELFYNSINKTQNKKIKKIIADVLDKSGRWDLYTKDIHYHAASNIEDLQKYIYKLFEKFGKKFTKAIENGKGLKKFPKFQIVINFGDINKNANMCTFLSNLISSYTSSLNKNNNTSYNNYLPYLDVYIYTTKQSKSLYKNLNNEFSGCLHLINEQEVIAFDFIQKYPVAKYLNENQIDYKTSLLKDDTKISICFVGFGETQQQIFKSLYSNTQFVKQVGDEIVAEEVKYYIYDKKPTWNDPEFRLTFNKYKDEFLAKCKKEDYYPLPQITEPEFVTTDITSNEFAERSAKLIDDHNNDKNIKYVVISLGNDFASLDYANKLWQTIKIKKIQNCHLFVKVNDTDSFNNISRIFNSPSEQLPTNSRNVYGCLLHTAYNYERVIMNDITDLSIMLDELYDITAGYNKTADRLYLSSNIVENARNHWSFKKEYARYSSICAALNMRSKLLCMGLDYVKESSNRKELFATNKDYWERLDSEEFRPVVGEAGNGKEFIKLHYNKDHYFKTNSRRWALIVLEHNRWDAFERTIGFIPRIKADVINKGQDSDKEEGIHACMTTMRGLESLQQDLITYYKNKNKKLSKDEINNLDKIQLDCLGFDTAWWFLKKIGYKIVAKEEANGSKAN